MCGTKIPAPFNHVDRYPCACCHVYSGRPSTDVSESGASGNTAARRRSSHSAMAGVNINSDSPQRYERASSLSAGSVGSGSYASAHAQRHAGGMQRQGNAGGMQRRQDNMQQPPLVSPDELVAMLDKICARMASKEWRDRGDAFPALVGLAGELNQFSDVHLTSVLEAVAPRLSDGNAKVNVQAVEVSRVLCWLCSVGSA